MKIGILTFYAADNYGAVFQTIASKYYLESLGHKVYVIDHLKSKKFTIPFFIKGFSVISNIKFCIQQIIKYPFIKRRNIIFYRFIKKYIDPYSGEWYTSPNNFDCFYVGSDQVWNPMYTQHYIPFFFCQFPGSKNKKCIAYSASMGINYIPEHLHSELVQYLKKFSAISVREKSTQKLVSPLVNIPIEVTIDPTFLLTKEQWLKLFPGKNQNNKCPYIIIFEVRHSELTNELADSISRKYNYKILKISSGINFQDKESYKTMNPTDFINAIANAKFVVTTSFHGTAFSLICKVPFYSIITKSNDNRIKDLLYSCGAEHRIINKIPTEINDELDWNRISHKLNTYIEKSQNYIKKSLILKTSKEQ